MQSEQIINTTIKKKDLEKVNEKYYKTITAAIGKLKELSGGRTNKDEYRIIIKEETFKEVFGFIPRKGIRKILFNIKCFFLDIKDRKRR